MTIRRQYQLPNCSLILDGLSIDPAPGNEDIMSLLVNAECRISGLERSINGGYNFFAALVRAVSQYSQEVLSGFAHPQVVEGEPLLVHINPGEGPYHHLVVQPEIADLGGTGDGRAIDIKLSAVQLFDLTEAVDQFFADKQTLPELEPSLSPLAKRFVRTEEPLSDRAIPAVLGIGGLVAATMAIGLLPLPEMRDPALDARGPEVAEVATADGQPDGGGEGPDGLVGTTPDDPEAEVAAVDSETGESEDVTASAEDTTDEAEQIALADDTVDEAEETDAADQPEATDSAAAEETAEESTQVAESADDADEESFSSFDEFESEGEVIASAGGELAFESDPPRDARNLSQIERLNGQLKRTIVDNREQPRFGDAISYRVRVNEAGEVIGYRPESDNAGPAIGETPLPNLLDAAAEVDEAVDYRVVFTERGVVEVSPWWGWSYYE